MREIQLTRGKVAIVDDEDYDELSKFSWFCSSNGYVGRNNSTVGGKPVPKQTLMHMQIIGNLEGFQIDHINRNKLDNRRCNLRHVTHQQNMQNIAGHGASQYKGVRWRKHCKKWQARSHYGGREHHIGYYDTEKEAAIAYNAVAAKQQGEYACLNIVD